MNTGKLLQEASAQERSAQERSGDVPSATTTTARGRLAAEAARADADVLLRLEGVTKLWNGRPVLEGVDLEVRAGTVTGVAGGNGAGKTTLLRIAGGMVVPNGGKTSFRGIDIERDRTNYQRGIGLLSAGDRGLYARLTVRQNLDIWGGLSGLSRRRRRHRIAEMLSEFRLDELADRRVDRLSMGQRQRVRLAMTFLHEPIIVLLDEPRTSLDEAGISLLAAALDRLVARAGAALWVSPDTDEPLVAEQWVLREGRLFPLGRAAVEPVEARAVGAR